MRVLLVLIVISSLQSCKSYKEFLVTNGNLTKQKGLTMEYHKLFVDNKIDKLHIYFNSELIKQSSYTITNKFLNVVLKNEKIDTLVFKNNFFDYSKHDSTLISSRYLIYKKTRTRDGSINLIFDKLTGTIIWQELYGQFAPSYILLK